jgi:hypothetical protein
LGVVRAVIGGREAGRGCYGYLGHSGR